jgi:hypothetical protein
MSSLHPLNPPAQDRSSAEPSVLHAHPQRMAATLQAIQYTRAIAAMLVVFYHLTVYIARITGDSRLHDVFGGRPGLYGVVAFFVLSGYLMADIAPKYPPVTFIVHRAIRIYPTYWLCVVLSSIFFSWLWFVTRPNADFVPNIHDMLFGHGMSRDVLRLTLAPMVFPDFPLGIEWTLLYETSFYAMIFVVSLAGQLRYLPHLVAGWLLLILWAAWVQPASQAGYTTPSITTLPFFGINAAFIFGVLSARMRRRSPPPRDRDLDWAIASGACRILSNSPCHDPDSCRHDPAHHGPDEPGGSQHAAAAAAPSPLRRLELRDVSRARSSYPCHDQAVTRLTNLADHGGRPRRRVLGLGSDWSDRREGLPQVEGQA